MTINITARTIRHYAGTLTIAAVMLFATTGAHANTPDVTARNHEIISQAFTDWAERGGPFTRVLSPDIEWTVHGSGPYARTYNGVESFAKDASAPLLSRLAGPLVPNVHHIWAVDDKVIVRFDGSAKTTSGGSYNNKFLWVLTMKDGKAVKAEAFLDMVAYQTVVDNNTPRAE